MRRALFIAACAVAACNTTGGKLITLPFSIGGVEHDAGTPLTFTTRKGWQVELDQARVALGPFYFNIQPPQTGTLRSGVVIMEVTSQVMVDALDPTLLGVDGGADGETGHAIATEIDLLPPDPSQTFDDQQTFGEASAQVAGTAQHLTADGGSVVIPFHGFISIDKSLANAADPLPALQRVNGAGCDLQFSDAPATLVGRVDPAPWFDGITFSDLIPPAPLCPDGGPGCGTAWTPDAGALSWTARSSFNKQLVTGLQSQTGAYLFALSVGGL
jgi:hypothetical protein